MTTVSRPLDGITVLELGALVAGPYCGMLLADLGADVIKVEPPEGDMARQFAPYVGTESAFFISVNRGKRSAVFDLKDPADRQAVLELAARSDVVLHNYRTGVAERLGLGYDDISAVNPGVVYCAISGFGPTGPMATRPGIDTLFQAESGMMAITGPPGGDPVKVGTNASDVYAATTAAAAINAALVQRATTGRGTRVDVALRDAFLALQACWFTSFLATGQQPEKLGAGSPFTAPTDVYATADGSIVVAVVNDKHWQIFCDVLGLNDLVDDSRYADNQSRVTHAENLRGRVTKALAERTTAEWLTGFDKAKIPAGRVMTYAEIEDDEQIAHNQMILTLDHPVTGPVRVQGVPFWIDGAKPPITLPAPRLGEHTDQVRATLNEQHAPSGERL